jgi:hypothetical protein
MVTAFAVGDTPLTAYAWLQLIALGSLTGVVGQLIRMVVGLKKLDDVASQSQQSFTDLISPSRIFVSLAIGAIAGTIAAATTVSDIAEVTAKQILALVAAGYVGADFIEGFMSSSSAASVAASAGTAPVQVAPVPAAPVPVPANDGAVG